MKCSLCGGRVEWQGPLLALTSSSNTKCLACGAINSQEAEMSEPVADDGDELWDADPDCVHDVVDVPAGGIKCTKCNGWKCL